MYCFVVDTFFDFKSVLCVIHLAVLYYVHVSCVSIIALLVSVTCSSQFRFSSRVIPRYLADFNLAIFTFFIFTLLRNSVYINKNY